MEAIISATITGLITLIVCIINNNYQQKSTRSLIEYKLDELKKRVDKHNNVIERVYELERNAAVTDEKIEVANHRIADLEKM